MARINMVIDDDLDRQFRSTVAKCFGMKKGNIKIAIEEAIKSWIEDKKKQESQ